jgi:hypothetical protein
MVKKVFSVNILYFDLGSGADYVYHGQMDFRGLHTEDKLRLSELQKRDYSKTYPGELFPEVYLIKVNNFNDISKDTLDEWIYFLKHTELPEDFKAKGLTNVAKSLNLNKMDTATQKEYADYLKNIRLTQKNIESIQKKSMLEGKIEVILRGFDSGLSISVLSEITQMSEEEVTEILRKNHKL